MVGRSHHSSPLLKSDPDINHPPYRAGYMSTYKCYQIIFLPKTFTRSIVNDYDSRLTCPVRTLVSKIIGCFLAFPSNPTPKTFRSYTMIIDNYDINVIVIIIISFIVIVVRAHVFERCRLFNRRTPSKYSGTIPTASCIHP